MKDRSTLLGETCRARLRAQLQKAKAIGASMRAGITDGFRSAAGKSVGA